MPDKKKTYKCDACNSGTGCELLHHLGGEGIPTKCPYGGRASWQEEEDV